MDQRFTLMLKSMLLAGLMITFNAFAQCNLSGPLDVCENQTAAYTLPFTSGYTYTWNVTGGGTVIGSGNSVNIAWTNTGTGNIFINVKNALNVVICTQAYTVNIHGKPSPQITPSFIAGCGGRKETDKGSCLVACDSTQIQYTTPYHAGSTYVWTVQGAANYNSNNNQLNVYWTATGAGVIKVTETNQWGCSKSTEICIDIVGKPKAKFISYPGLSGLSINACLNQNIQFVDQSTAGVGSPIASWSWYFGDGQSAFESAPGIGNTEHAYSNPGTYTVMLVVENQCKCKDTAYATVVVSNTVAPEIYCISTVCPNTTVTYHTNAQSCNNYLWTVSNGTIIGNNNDSTITVQWGNNGPGSLSLQVNCPGFCNTATTVFVPIISPNASIQGPSQVCLNECATYHISCSIPIDSIRWHFPPGVTVMTDSINVHEVQVCFYQTVTGNITADYYHHAPGSQPNLNCGGSSVLNVSTKPKLSVYGNFTFCENNNYSFGISPAPTANMVWTISTLNNTPLYTSTTNGNNPFAGNWNLGPGQFQLTVTDPNGNYCNSPYKKLIQVIAKPNPVDSIIGQNPICPNNTYNYTGIASSSDYYIGWTTNNGSPATSIGNNIGITWANTGPYAVNAYQIDPVSGCKSDAYTLNIVSALPMLPSPITGTQSVCANSNHNYSTSAYGNDYIWSINPSLAGSIANGQHNNAIQVQWNNYSGSAWLVLQRKACGSSRKDSILITFTGPAAPTITAQNTICAGVMLTATSSAAMSYAWNFGDGGISISNPGLHTYQNPGNYIITLTATYGGNCPGTASTTKSISVLPKPDINISTPQPNEFCSTPILTNMYIAAPAVNTTYQWYNPSSISGATGTSYSATATGSYFVVGTNAYGCKDTSNVIPVALINCTPCKPGVYTLNYNRYRQGCNKDSFQAITSSGVSNLSWSYDDPYSNATGTGSSVSHIFTNPGYYRVKLCADVPNAAGNGTCNVCIYKVDTIKYIPNFYDSIYCKQYSDSLKIKLVNTSKILTGYPAPSYYWTVNPGALNSTLKNPSFTLASGTYSITLTINGICSITKTISINPLVNASFTVQDSVCQGTPVQFTNNSSNNPLSYNWTFGDGASSHIWSPIRTYANAGNYFAVLQLVNAYGCSDSAKRKVTVLPNTLGGMLSANGALRFCEGDSVKLTCNPSNGYPAYAYLWSNLKTNPFIWAKQSGSYSVELTDSKGCFYITNPINVLVKSKPKPNIIGPIDVCKGSNYVFTANYPNINGSNFQWLLDNSAQFNNSNSFNLNTYNLSLGWHQLVVQVTSPDTCLGVDTLNFQLHSVPNVSITNNNSGCAGQINQLIATSTSPGIDQFYWSNGITNDTMQTGIANAYSVTVIDSFGCKASASSMIHPLPDFCGFKSGCYDICDSVTQLVWFAPPGYASYQWLYNGNPIAWATNDTFHIPLYQSGTYSVKVITANGCADESEPFDIQFVHCGGCIFNPSIQVNCAPIDANGNPTYTLNLNIYNSMGSGANLSMSSNQGSISNVTPSNLSTGYNNITATFTDQLPHSNYACITIQMVQGNQHCDTSICFKLPDCFNKDCKIASKITQFNCIGQDANGNNQYYVCMDVNWSGSNGSTLTITSTVGSFVNNPVSINNGLQNICYTYTDLPPSNTGGTIYLYAFDSITQKICKDSFKRDYKPCPQDSCSIGVYGMCAHCHERGNNGWTYDLDITVMNPFSSNANISISPINAGNFNGINPISVGPGIQSFNVSFTDINPHDPIICFKVLLTDPLSGRSCFKTVCMALPNCDSLNTHIMINTVEQFRWSVYPNPSNQISCIDYVFERPIEGLICKLMDINGRLIYETILNNNSGKHYLNTQNFDSGLYFIQLEEAGRVIAQQKLIINH